jgi:UDP-N-acetyl-D-galactosamine dehydrogenase
MDSFPKIAVVGLGYVGLPLAVHLSRHFAVAGFDIDASRVTALAAGDDVTGEISEQDLARAAVTFSANEASLDGIDVYIVTVPTPVDAANTPDLSAIEGACALIGRHLAKGAIVVFECTVYPGVTEDICGRALAVASGLKAGRDFFLGYSPERINPGDKEHTVERVTKIVAGETPAVTARLVEIYGALTGGNIFVAADIKTAEAAKVIENAQRDLNIAFINEVTMIFDRLGLSASDVLAAARTKWNFQDFRPGLVGGHCIGVDPYYLAHCAQQAGHHPEIILAGRRINDAMGEFVAGRIDAALGKAGARILILGLTFKENVPDLRNSKVIDVIKGLTARGHQVEVHDPLADQGEAERLYGIRPIDGLDGQAGLDCIVGAVAHRAYRNLDGAALAALLAPAGLLADIKDMWRDVTLPDGCRRWRL